MNIISIMIKEIKQDLRNPKSMIMMTAFPLVLIIVLGTAFSKSFGKSVDIETPKVLYSIKNSGEVAESFKSNFIDKGKEYNINFIKTDNIETAKKKLVENNKYACVIVMDSDTKIKVFNKDKSNLEGGVVNSFITNYAERYNIIAEIAKVNPSGINKALSSNKIDYSYISSINKKNKPSSLNYYAVAEISLIIMYASMTGLYSIVGEKSTKTGERVLSGPVRKYEFLLGKVIGGVLITIFQITIVLLFSRFILNVNYGSDIFTIVLLFISQMIMAISIGIGIGFAFKSDNVAAGILNFFIPFIVFLGGSYCPVDNIGAGIFSNYITYISPVRWINQSIFGVIYSNNYDKVIPTILINICIAMLFLIIGSLAFRKERA